MRRLLTMWCAALAALGMLAKGEAVTSAPAGRVAAAEGTPTLANPTADVPEFGELTVITSDRLLYDGRRQLIELSGSVVVSDPQVKMKADHVRIDLAGTNEVRLVTATGRVVISQADKHAWAGRATYEVAEGRFVLEDNPRILRGRDMMTADRIVFWRDQDRLECYPNARLILQPDPKRGDLLKGVR
ncbi:MAG: hypothetical protein N2652_04550 [Kiritimatiellae bacterium]|nr:hypothetical protein [Kiritimatiellia bacterium]